MFEINKEEMMNAQAEKKAKKMLSKMMTDMILNSDTAPESIKLSVRVLDKAKDIHDLLEEGFVLKYVAPGNQANVETLKKILEYLELVEVGMKQFVETTPFVAHTEEDDEI